MANFRARTSQKPLRFAVNPPIVEWMLRFGAELAESIKARIQQAVNVYDAAAKPLSMRYRERYNKAGRLAWMGADRGYRVQKIRAGGKPIRDWTLTGDTLESMRTLRAQPGRAVIGFSDPALALRAQRAQKSDPMFGVAPSNRAYIAQRISQQQWIRFDREQAAV